MKIQFIEGVLEYANGAEYHRKNDGKPFEVDRRFAEDVLLPSGFFEVVEEPDVEEGVTKPKLMAMKKDDLLAHAETIGVPDVTADNNKEEIADKILAHNEEEAQN
jgi:hypothetical protein